MFGFTVIIIIIIDTAVNNKVAESGSKLNSGKVEYLFGIHVQRFYVLIIASTYCWKNTLIISTPADCSVVISLLNPLEICLEIVKMYV